MPSTSWGLLVPVKLLERAKSRLGPVSGVDREELALAFAADVVQAALACAAVARLVVVTDDARAATALAGPRVTVVGDGPSEGLNAALAHAAGRLRQDHPDLGVASCTADLPALRSGDLASALAQVRTRGVVPDASGVGTTLLAAAPGHDLRPAYGGRSHARHVASGAEPLPAGASLRRDVDTPEDLRAAVRLGVGPHTSAALAARPARGA